MCVALSHLQVDSKPLPRMLIQPKLKYHIYSYVKCLFKLHDGMVFTRVG